ncbi:deoxyuridine 5'-triphosphate nucleotidohydrolase [endosymbiont of Acanthamoeba sp. UWC8]|nr:dUTP diphosphatase [Candidatus Jidaibacter acanthamoeba]AIF81899.1 deoxyuridine 5'-triphosphate nucleotidohydrolase [endosymbiont of Acanthamoeba sp. UWC8]MBA8666406.1 dUTP diphosphatase [Holosporaceae bacterium 'Namur']
MSIENILIKKLSNLNELPIPSYATINSAGMDLTAAIEEDITLKPLERKAIPTGIAIALSEGYEAQVRPRSGLALKSGITVANAPGTIDADYRGEICAILINLSDKDFVITRGMRIAQMVIAKYSKVNWNIVEELPETERGAGGFGSTGV